MRKLTSVFVTVLLILSLAVAASAAETVRAMVDDLPTVEEFKALNSEAQLEAYNRTQAAYDAYMALSGEEKAQLQGTEERFGELFSYFNAQIMPIESTGKGGKISVNGVGWAVAAALLAVIVLLARKKK